MGFWQQAWEYQAPGTEPGKLFPAIVGVAKTGTAVIGAAATVGPMLISAGPLLAVLYAARQMKVI